MNVGNFPLRAIVGFRSIFPSVILIWRTYAIYNKSKKVFYGLTGLWAVRPLHHTTVDVLKSPIAPWPSGIVFLVIVPSICYM